MDLKPVPVTAATIADDGTVTVTPVAPPGVTTRPASPTVLKLADLVELRRGERPAANGPFVLWLTDGQRLVGQPRGIDGETLAWQTAVVGTRPVPLRNAVAITRSSVAAPDTAANPAPVRDEVRLANGDTVVGLIAAADHAAVTVDTDTGPTPVPLDAVSTIRFAAAGGGVAPPGVSRLRVTIDEGTTVDVAALRLDAARAVITPAAGDEPLTLPADRLVVVEHVDGPVSWLSDRAPAAVEYAPYLTEHYPPRTDRSADGAPLRLDGRTYHHGLGLHARTRMTWPLDPAAGYARFRTRYAVRDANRFADAVVRIRLDDAVAHEQHVRAGHASDVVTLDLGAARSITLEVDYATGGATHDAVDFIQPALLR